MRPTRRPRTAVVGAGRGGLVRAGVLRPHVRQVTVFEREASTGVRPQGARTRGGACRHGPRPWAA
ncbi:NAD(P)-binding protein [Streptomyces sp. NPDC053086]|uniref:NAD(P)-binding protein n=1 Tax=unclassified Streptomyces TaxID=2593676 RepID=UPI0037D51601